MRLVRTSIYELEGLVMNKIKPFTVVKVRVIIFLSQVERD